MVQSARVAMVLFPTMYSIIKTIHLHLPMTVKIKSPDLPVYRTSTGKKSSPVISPIVTWHPSVIWNRSNFIK